MHVVGHIGINAVKKENRQKDKANGKRTEICQCIGTSSNYSQELK